MDRTAAEHLANEAKSLTFRELPPEVIHQVKRSLIDTIGLGFGGYLSEPSNILQSVIREANGPAESTIFVNGLKASCLDATLANGLMVRYNNMFDRAFLTKDSLNPAGSNCESIPALLAVGERQHSSGQDVIVAIVLAYELLNKIFDSLGGDNKILDSRGWTHETMRTPCAMALVTGRLLGLNEEQMAHALALAGCFHLELRILNSGENELTMARSLRFAYGAYGGIHGAMLARKGFKGPLDVFEGRHGIDEVVAGGKMDLEKLKQPRKAWTILYTQMSNLGVGVHMHGLIEATLKVVREHDIKAKDVANVRITTNSTTHRILANPTTRRYPKNKETADHSSYYCAAVSILDRAIGLEQFSDEKLQDIRVKELMDKVQIESDPKLDAYYNPGIVEISTYDSKKYTGTVLHPKGGAMNPMTDADIEEKFRSAAAKFMGEKQMKQIIDTVYNLEKFDDIGDLVKLLVVAGPTGRVLVAS